MAIDLNSVESPIVKIKKSTEPRKALKPWDLHIDKNRTTNKLPTKYQQSTNKLPTNHQQTTNKVPTELPTNYQQTTNESTNKVPTNFCFERLVGIQLKIIIFLCSICMKKASLETGFVEIKDIALAAESDRKSTKESIRRLEQKNIIEKIDYINGRLGKTNYRIDNIIYDEYLQLLTSNKLPTKYQQTTNKLPTELPTELSSNSSNNINNTITKHEGLENLDFAGLDVSIGFTKEDLIYNIDDISLSVEEIQMSIFRMAHDLNHKLIPSKYNSKLGLFISGLKKNGYRSFDDKYKTPIEIEEKERLEYFEKIKKEREEIKRKTIDIGFENWLDKLSQKEQFQLAKKLSKYSITESQYPSNWTRNLLKTHYLSTEFEKDCKY